MANYNCDQVDANNIHEMNMCRAHAPQGFLCTRPEGHEGKHHAHGVDWECYEVW